MAKILVEALPPELLQRVAEYTANPADLQALCLASKCLRTAATPRLYRTVRVGKGWSHLRLGYGLLRRDNPGLAHLQHLHVLGALQVNKMNQVDAIRILLSFLPRDRLLTVNISDMLVDQSTLCLLLSQQRHISDLSLGVSMSAGSWYKDCGAFGSNPWSEIKSLCLPRIIGHVNDLDFYSSIISEAPLQALSLLTTATELEGSELEETEAALDDTDEKDGLLFKILQPDANEEQSRIHLKLKQLTISGRNLCRVERNLTPYIQLSLLEDLVLWDCENSQVMLDAIIKSLEQNGTRLRGFSLRCSKIDIASLESFLKAFSGLEILHIVLSSKHRLIQFEALDNHKNTLKSFGLVLGFKSSRPSTLTTAEWQDFAKLGSQFAQLRQLAIQMPALELGQSPNGWTKFEYALRSVSNISNLTTLRITNWPNAPCASFVTLSNDRMRWRRQTHYDQVNLSAYITHLEYFLNKHVSRTLPTLHGLDRLRLICFKTVGRGIITDSIISVPAKTACFVPVKLIDVFGRPRNAFQAVPPQEIEYIEPDCGILTGLSPDDKL